MSSGVGRRCGSDLALLWLRHSLAATALTRPLAWDPPYAVGTAFKRQKKKKNYFRIAKNNRTSIYWNWLQLGRTLIFPVWVLLYNDTLYALGTALPMTIKNSRKGRIFISLWSIHQMSWVSGRCPLLGDWCKLQWKTKSPCQSSGKKSPIKKWPLTHSQYHTSKARNNRYF